MEDVEARIRRGNQIYFDRDSPCLEGLIADIRQSDHRTVILWALDLAEGIVRDLKERHPQEVRPQNCVTACRDWARGLIRMPQARRAILACHQAAKELDPIAGALCHAVGHAGAAVHVETHAMGLPMYELTAIVRRLGHKNYQTAVLERIRDYRQGLAAWERDPSRFNGPWAAFLLKGAPNREQILWEKHRSQTDVRTPDPKESTMTEKKDAKHLKTAHDELTRDRRQEVLATLQARFEANRHRHPRTEWDHVVKRLEAAPEKVWALAQMEETGGEPDVVAGEGKGEILFFDCAPESPKGRRSLCYDPEALASRRENKPVHSAIGMAQGMGIELLDEMDYRILQELEPVDQKTSSWLETPQRIRDLGGALFGDRRYDTVFVYHNGAESYYGARGFRGKLRV